MLGVCFEFPNETLFVERTCPSKFRRSGEAATTTAGMSDAEMDVLADVTHESDADGASALMDEVQALLDKFISDPNDAAVASDALIKVTVDASLTIFIFIHAHTRTDTGWMIRTYRGDPSVVFVPVWVGVWRLYIRAPERKNQLAYALPSAIFGTSRLDARIYCTYMYNTWTKIRIRALATTQAASLYEREELVFRNKCSDVFSRDRENFSIWEMLELVVRNETTLGTLFSAIEQRRDAVLQVRTPIRLPWQGCHCVCTSLHHHIFTYAPMLCSFGGYEQL